MVVRSSFASLHIPVSLAYLVRPTFKDLAESIPDVDARARTFEEIYLRTVGILLEEWTHKTNPITEQADRAQVGEARHRGGQRQWLQSGVKPVEVEGRHLITTATPIDEMELLLPPPGFAGMQWTLQRVGEHIAADLARVRELQPLRRHECPMVMTIPRRVSDADVKIGGLQLLAARIGQIVYASGEWHGRDRTTRQGEAWLVPHGPDALAQCERLAAFMSAERRAIPPAALQ